MGIEEDDGRIVATYPLGTEVDFPGKTNAIVPASDSKPGEGWEAIVKVAGTAILALDRLPTSGCAYALFR